MLQIAGVAVQRGDRLYVTQAGAFGTVIDLTPTIATVRVERPQGYRDFSVEQGGVVAGQRVAYWHAPLILDLPKGVDEKHTQIATVVATLVEVL